MRSGHWDTGTPGRRDAGTPGRRDAGTPGRREIGRTEDAAGRNSIGARARGFPCEKRPKVPRSWAADRPARVTLEPAATAPTKSDPHLVRSPAAGAAPGATASPAARPTSTARVWPTCCSP
jgi:hypothetical protein